MAEPEKPIEPSTNDATGNSDRRSGKEQAQVNNPKLSKNKVEERRANKSISKNNVDEKSNEDQKLTQASVTSESAKRKSSKSKKRNSKGKRERPDKSAKKGAEPVGRFNPYQSWLGIPIDDGIIDHYKLLGLERFETEKTAIEDAADDRMSRVRIHQTGPRGELTQVLLNQIADAKLCLLNPESKQAYDSQLRSNMAVRESTGNSRLPIEDFQVQQPVIITQQAIAEPPIDRNATKAIVAQKTIQEIETHIIQPKRFGWELILFVSLFGLMIGGAAVAVLIVWLMN